MLTAEALTVHYTRAKTPAVEGASFSMERGAVAWLLGDNGSGKSTLGLAACGLIPHVVPARREGSLTVGGVDPASLKAGERVSLTAMVPQDPDSALGTLSIPAELALSLENRGVEPSAVKRRVAAALEEFGLTALANRSSDQSLAALSGGEKQLVNLAAATIAPPELLILDEPAAYLDESNRALLENTLESMRRRLPSLSILAIEHRPEGLPPADMVLRCTGGRIENSRRASLTPPMPWGGNFPRIAEPEMPRSGGELLRIEDLAFAWPSKPASTPPREIFDGLGISVRGGEIVVVRGENGSGKSTLFKLISGVLRPRRGRIEADTIAYVPQNPEHLFITHRVADELAGCAPAGSGSGSGCGSGEAAAVTALAAQFGLGELLQRNPYELSAGQKRRLSIAAAASTDARLVLMDEPTFGLDRQGVAALITAIAELRRRGCAQLIATHDTAFAAAVAERTLTIADGRLVKADSRTNNEES